MFSSLKCCSEFFLNLSPIYTKLCAQTFLPIFRLITIFDHNVVNIMALPSDGNGHSIVNVNGQSFVKKR